jgi:hypothetical protein
MATRIYTLQGTIPANTSDVELTGSPLSPPTGVKWTVVELRPVASADVAFSFFFDTELYHTITYADINLYKKPHTLALDLATPHKYSVRCSNPTASPQDVAVTVVIEESPQAT